MKSQFAGLNLIALVGLVAFVAGCASTAGPQLVRIAVRDGAQIALFRNPNALPGVEAGADVLCAAANQTNPSPAALVAALDAYGKVTPESFLLLTTGIDIYSFAFANLKSTNSSAIRPYAQATCDGFNDAIALAKGGWIPPVGRNAIPMLLKGPRKPGPVLDPRFPKMKQ